MSVTIAAIGSPADEPAPYLAEFTRLRGEVRQLGEQLDQIEVELRKLLNDLMQQRFEDYRLKQFSENPIIRMLAVMVAIAVGIRLIFELLEPVWPYLVAALIVFTVVRIISWYRERW